MAGNGNKIIRLYVSLVAIVFLAACKKDSPVFPEGFGPGQANTPTYLPSGKSSDWTYTIKDEDQFITSKHTMTGVKVNVSGRAFNEVLIKSTNNPASEKFHYNLTNHIYTLRSESLGYGLAQEFEYLNDTAAVNDTWTTFISEGLGNEDLGKQIEGKLIAKDLTKIVSGIKFKEVIHTRLKIQDNMTDGFGDFAIYDFYVAKNVGIIQIDIKSEMLGVNTSMQLVSYSIK